MFEQTYKTIFVCYIQSINYLFTYWNTDARLSTIANLTLFPIQSFISFYALITDCQKGERGDRGGYGEKGERGLSGSPGRDVIFLNIYVFLLYINKYIYKKITLSIQMSFSKIFENKRYYSCQNFNLNKI